MSSVLPLSQPAISHHVRNDRWHVAVYATLALACVVNAGTVYVSMNQANSNPIKKRWGGFNERPMDEECYRKERTAMLLSFWLGCLGVDQFYAHHWPLAVFKFLALVFTGVRIISVKNTRRNTETTFRLTTMPVWSWWAVDVSLWMIGGVYGTPGCPGGSREGWRY